MSNYIECSLSRAKRSDYSGSREHLWRGGAAVDAQVHEGVGSTDAHCTYRVGRYSRKKKKEIFRKWIFSSDAHIYYRLPSKSSYLRSTSCRTNALSRLSRWYARCVAIFAEVRDVKSSCLHWIRCYFMLKYWELGFTTAFEENCWNMRWDEFTRSESHAQYISLSYATRSKAKTQRLLDVYKKWGNPS